MTNKTTVPLEAIGKILAEVMEQAVKNGADSRSMPDDYVAVAHFTCFPEKYAPAAAPVQAQEPSNEIKSMIDELDAKENAETNYCVPVQPVAVPDGPYTFPIGEDGEYMILDKDGQQVGTVLYYHAAKVIAAALAAPAAQGDAIEGELTKIVKSGAEKDLPGFLEWIADRLVYVHSENNNVDYVQTLRTRAKQLRAAIAAKAES